METELKNQGTFQEHYGRFPYIVHRMFSGIYRQIPIVFSHEHEQGELPGVTIRLNGCAWYSDLLTVSTSTQLANVIALDHRLEARCAMHKASPWS
jgi:hypothetical protein